MTVPGWKSTPREDGAPSDRGGGNSVFASNPKHKKKKRMKNIAYATWNVQGILYKPREVSEQLERYQINIAALTETKKKENGCKGLGEYILFFNGVPTANKARAGVAIAIHKKLKTYAKSWEAINERLTHCTIVVVYAPTDGTIVEMKDAFEYRLNKLLDNTSRRKEIFFW